MKKYGEINIVVISVLYNFLLLIVILVFVIRVASYFHSRRMIFKSQGDLSLMIDNFKINLQY